MPIFAAMEAVAEKTPDAPVLRFLKETLSYEELSRRSDQLAAMLIQQGVAKGDRIGLYFNKSIESVVALYGVMKAGAVYVPLDPGAPAARLQSVMRLCDIQVLISHPPKARDLLEIVQSNGARPELRCVIGLDDPLACCARTLSWADLDQAESFVRPELSGDDLAYILFSPP